MSYYNVLLISNKFIRWKVSSKFVNLRYSSSLIKLVTVSCCLRMAIFFHQDILSLQWHENHAIAASVTKCELSPIFRKIESFCLVSTKLKVCVPLKRMFVPKDTV